MRLLIAKVRKKRLYAVLTLSRPAKTGYEVKVRGVGEEGGERGERKNMYSR